MQNWQPCAIGALPCIFDPNGAVKFHTQALHATSGVPFDDVANGDRGGGGGGSDACADARLPESVEPKDMAPAGLLICDASTAPSGSGTCMSWEGGPPGGASRGQGCAR